jgi:hypothetical protein
MLVTSSMFLLLRSSRNGFCTIDPEDAQTASMWVNPAASSSAIVRPSITVRDPIPCSTGYDSCAPTRRPQNDGPARLAIEPPRRTMR